MFTILQQSMASQFMLLTLLLIKELDAAVLLVVVVKQSLKVRVVGVSVVLWQFGVFRSPQARAFFD